MPDKKIVIVGGGFAGIRAARHLANQSGVQVTLISDKDYFCYYPTLYNAATGHPGSESSIPLSNIFDQVTNITLVKDTLVDINMTKRQVITASGQTYHYHQLILALGVVTSYFGIAGLEEYSFGVKSIEQVSELKLHFHQLMIDTKQPDRQYVVIGAGPTGVELSAAMASYLKQLVKKYRLRRSKINICLIEAAPRVLPRSSESVSAKVEARLKKLGVKVMTNQKVEGSTAESLTVNGQKISSQTIIWTAGVTNHSFYKDHPTIFTLNERGKVVVDEYLQAVKNIYVLGDNAATPFAGLAQIAVHDGQFVAENILRQLRGHSPHTYQASQPATVVPVGHQWAVVEWGSLSITGRVGYWMRRAADLVGYIDILPVGKAIKLWAARHQHDLEPIQD